MPTRTILCEDCAGETAALTAGGAIEVSCTPIADRPGFCKLVWEWPAAAAAPTSAKSKARKPATAKPKAKRKRRT